MISSPSSYLDRLELCASEAPGALAIIETDGRRMPRQALVDQVRHVAAGLTASGMRGGDQALFSVRPGIDALVLILAIHEAGGVIVPIDPLMGSELFAARCRMLSPAWVFAESLLLASAAPWLRFLLRRRQMHLVPLGTVRGVRFVRAGRWLPGVPPSITVRGLASSGRLHPDGREGRKDSDDAFVVFTSGTTGTPKGVVHTRGSLDATLSSVGRELHALEGDVVYSRELHLVLPALFHGARVVVSRGTRFNAAETVEHLERFGVTHMFAVPAECQQLADHCTSTGRRLPDRLRMLLIGGAPVPTALLRRINESLSAATDVWCIYGMTEMLPIARVSVREKLEWSGEGDFVGLPVDGVLARVAPNGELIVGGPGLFSRYLGQPAVAEHPTGDLARIGKDGITLLGRSKDMIIRGEYNIYPALYEPAFERLPGVRRCAIIGIPAGAASDERVVVVVEPDAGVDAAELEKSVANELAKRGIDIDAFAHPDHIMALQLPQSGRSSKVDKEALRRIAGERFR